MSDFAKEVREAFDEDLQADKENRDEMVIDLKFCGFEQWNEQIKQLREENEPYPLPCLTINRTNQFVNQVVGDWRADPKSIKVLPRERGDKETAEVRSELVRSIELQSRAGRVYTQALTHAVQCGQGAFEVTLEEAYDDPFVRDLFIRGIPNPLSVLFDSQSADPTARDAKRAWKLDRMRRRDYKKEYPEGGDPDSFDAETLEKGWAEDGGDWVRLAEYWRLIERPRTIAMQRDGKIIDVTNRLKRNKGRIDESAPWMQNVLRDSMGQPRIRKAQCRYAQMVITNGQEELTDPFELKLPRLPIIRVMGQEVWIGDRRVRFGLVRAMRDPQQLDNYARSVSAELWISAQRANYTAEAKSVKGRENDWPNTQIYNDGTAAPEEVTQNNLAAIMSQAQMFAQDMKDVTGLHDASLGARSNETSGVAIARRQNEGDIATVFFGDNMAASQEEAGEILNCLFEVAYDTARTLRVVGIDDAPRLIRVNDPKDPESIDLGSGRYDTVSSTGPAYATRRQEAGAQLMELARGNGGMMERAGDLIVKALDVPDGEELAERLRPAGLPGDDEDMTDEQRQALAQQQQMAQQQQQMEMRAADAELRKKEADARKAEAEADEAEAKAAMAKSEAQEVEAKLVATAAGLAAAADGEDTLSGGAAMPSDQS